MLMYLPALPALQVSIKNSSSDSVLELFEVSRVNKAPHLPSTSSYLSSSNQPRNAIPSGILGSPTDTSVSGLLACDVAASVAASLDVQRSKAGAGDGDVPLPLTNAAATAAARRSGSTSAQRTRRDRQQLLQSAVALAKTAMEARAERYLQMAAAGHASQQQGLQGPAGGTEGEGERHKPGGMGEGGVRQQEGGQGSVHVLEDAGAAHGDGGKVVGAHRATAGPGKRPEQAGLSQGEVMPGSAPAQGCTTHNASAPTHAADLEAIQVHVAQEGHSHQKGRHQGMQWEAAHPPRLVGRLPLPKPGASRHAQQIAAAAAASVRAQEAVDSVSGIASLLGRIGSEIVRSRPGSDRGSSKGGMTRMAVTGGASSTSSLGSRPLPLIQQHLASEGSFIASRGSFDAASSPGMMSSVNQGGMAPTRFGMVPKARRKSLLSGGHPPAAGR